MSTMTFDATAKVRLIQMPAGTYYLTDPCYCFDAEWFDVLTACNMLDPKDTSYCYAGAFKGRVMMAFGTAHGDGVYYDNEGREYGVDAGMIGLVPVEIASVKPDSGRVVTFDKPFVCRRTKNGQLTFGSITIDTDE